MNSPPVTVILSFSETVHWDWICCHYRSALSAFNPISDTTGSFGLSALEDYLAVVREMSSGSPCRWGRDKRFEFKKINKRSIRARFTSEHLPAHLT